MQWFIVGTRCPTVLILQPFKNQFVDLICIWRCNIVKVSCATTPYIRISLYPKAFAHDSIVEARKVYKTFV